MVNEISSEQDVLERSLLAFIRILGRNKKKLILAIFLGGCTGFALSYLVAKKYTANAELLPEFARSNLGNLGSLASLAGLDGGSAESDALRPDLYPNILQSSPAVLHLLRQPVQSDSGRSFPTLLAYFENLHGVKINPVFLQEIASDSLFKYKPEELRIISQLKGSINSSFDKKSGIVQVAVEMTDPKVATMVLINCIKYLKQSVTEYRYGKNRDQGKFINSQLKAAQDRMNKARYNLQAYRDKNRNVFSNTAKIQEQKMQEDYSIAFSIYNELLGESERLNISSQDEKPLFQVLNPPVIPSSKSSPNRLFFGVGGSIAFFILMILALIPWKKLTGGN